MSTSPHHPMVSVRGWLPAVALVVAALVVASCETIPIETRILSEPPGARIEVNGRYVGPTPVSVMLRQTPNHHKLKQNVFITATPASGTEEAQTKKLKKSWVVPLEVMFLFEEPPPAADP